MPQRPPDHLRRRLSIALLGAATAPLALPRIAAAALPPIEVWTGPSCGCCHEWVAHLRANGFEVTTHDGGNSAARERLGMPVRYGSCHTGAIAGYAIEGHVPARDIRRLVDERPEAVGLAVPAMPRGSPGMEVGDIVDPYDVLLVQRDGTATVYQSYR